MIEGIQVKVCGLRTLADAHCANACGADFLGFILHEKSPRHLALADYRALAAGLPGCRKVAVSVEPDEGDLLVMRDLGFDRYQVHFRHDLPLRVIEGWAHRVGADNLWLAPKLPPALDLPVEWLPLASAILLDTFDPALYGGTGRVGDWTKFKRHCLGHPRMSWILSGGLNPGNVGEALEQTEARFLDVNSGVESAPGIKDPGKIRAFAAAIRGARLRL